MMSRIVAKRLVEHLERSGFVVMNRPPIGGSAPPFRFLRCSPFALLNEIAIRCRLRCCIATII
jgi:hypothetical protein